ncbi:ANTAR domain-containing response regulator [Pseudoduganella umbonata]|uniref:Response regulator n=1 Tax=Pseudoduganella umbonata TaxID=864828 RepID=A0A4P8HUB3_9BURK|nr:response regulator [Pseudoduganella umbonata]MBB3220319.1 two-component system chemotaxis response regulator CheY [Pseudoduganella umbonata]QCP12140.1 response regulator [Pseudoduganella umbonata]
MLKAVIIDGSAVARGLLNTVLTDGGYDVVGQAHTCAAGTALLIKFNPQIVCINRDQLEQDVPAVEAMRRQWPKALIFMVSSEFDAATVQKAHAMGINGFIVKPFNAGTVLKTIRNTVIAMVKRQQKVQEESGGPEPAARE